MPHMGSGQKLSALQYNTDVHRGITLIDEQIPTSNMADVTFNDIDQGFQALWLVASSGHDGAGFDGHRAQFNGDTSASYTFWFHSVDSNGSAQNNVIPDATSASLGNIGNVLATSTSSIVPAYSRTDRQKTLHTSYGVILSDNTAGSHRVGDVISRWNSTAAITDLRIFVSSGTNILAGSLFQLYGLGRSG